EQGALLLGKGSFALTLPAETPPDAPLFQLHPASNGLSQYRPADGEPALLDRKHCGMVVLIELDQQEGPIVCGLPDWRAIQDRHAASWAHDPLGLVWLQQEKVLENQERLQEILRVIGTLPVTIENVDEPTRTIAFSTRNLPDLSEVRPQQVVMARVAGALSHGKRALLRTGASLFILPAEELIAGLPATYEQTALEALAREGTLIWLRKTREGTFKPGIVEDARSHEAQVEAIAMMSDLYGEHHGMLCRSIQSQRLYWLFAQQASWYPFTPEQLAFLSSERSFKVQIERTSGPLRLSALAALEARQELSKLEIGSQLHIRLLKKLDAQGGKYRYLAEHSGTRMLLLCESSSEESQKGTIAAEVIRLVTSFPPEVVVSPVSSRRYVLDVPTWLLEPHRHAEQPDE